MPTIKENKQTWGASYDWSHAGDEWSESWGSAPAQWDGCLLPRIFPFLGGRILEIAPGRGRWTQFLHAQCTSLVGIDLAASCVEYCNKRFKGHRNLEFKVNDGLTLAIVEDASIDFVFSFDSLVHAESDVISSYVTELARVLRPNGVAFIHHSNIGSIPALFLLWNKIKRRLGIPAPHHWRARSMSARKMRVFVERSGMSILQQELISWVGEAMLIDCISTIINTPDKKGVLIKNNRFMEEAAAIKRIAGYRGVGDPEYAEVR
jgi:ubiquinone/menaquinone biosynthesis C-methylase UbiE